MSVSYKGFLATFLVSVMALGCNDSNFASGNKNNDAKKGLPATGKSNESSAPSNPNDSDAAGKDPNNLENPDSSTVAPGDIEIKNGEICYKKTPPVNIGIALDTTGSMQAQIDSIKNNLKSFVGKVKSISLPGGRKLESVKVGLVTFKDNVDQTFALTADMDSLANRIGSIVAGGGGDLPEAGYRGVYNSLNMLYSETKGLPNKTAVNVVLVISDTFAHDGGPDYTGFGSVTRNFDSPSLKKVIPSKLFKNILIYSAVPTYGPMAGIPFASPEEQWTAMREYWKTQNPDVKDAPGGSLGYPFNGAMLLTALPEALRERIKFCGE